MPSSNLSFALDPTHASVSSRANTLGLDYTSDGTLSLISGLEPYNAYIGGFANDSYVTGKIQDAGGGLVPQTLTTAVYNRIHLVAGETLTISAQFVPGDYHFNDEAIALLQDSNGNITPARIANTQAVIDNNYNEFYDLKFTAGATSDYNLLIGVADIGSTTNHSYLQINGIKIGVPAGSYSVGSSGILLSDQSILRSDGSIAVGGTIRSGFLSTSGAGLVSGLESLLSARLITQDGGGLISQDGGSLISQDGGTLISQDGGSVISNDGGSVISNDGGSLTGNTAGLISSLQANISAANFLSNRTYQAASLNGLGGSHNYGLLSLDGNTEPLPTSYSAPVPGLEVNASGGASGNGHAENSAVADLGGGKYVVAFDEYKPDANGARAYAIRAQVITNDANGTLVGQEYSFGGGESNNPILNSASVASLGGGAFVVAWADTQHLRPFDGASTTGSDLFAEIVGADGTQGAQFQINTLSVSAEQDGNVQVAALKGGGFVAVWGSRSGNTDRDLSSIRGQVYNADGTPKGAAFKLSGSSVLADLTTPTVTALSNGGFAIAFAGRAVDPSSGTVITGIGALAYDANATAASKNPTVVAISTTDTIYSPSIAALPNGNIAVAWYDSQSANPYAAQLDTMLLSPALAPLYDAPTVAAPTAASFYGRPNLAALSDGKFAVAYTDGATSSTSQAQILSSTNDLYGPSFNVYAPGGGDREVSPALVQLSGGALVATSTHGFNSPSASDVRALPINVGGSAAASIGAPGTGAAVDGYISGATVFADANGNGTLDAGEASATTTSTGLFTLPSGAAGPLVLTGGTDLATGKPFTGRYTAPAGAQTVDALTTLVQNIVLTGADIGTAQMKVATAFGLAADTALTQIDPVAAASQGGATGRGVLIDNALVADIAVLATAAGATNPLAVFATQIAAQNGFTPFDPSSTSALAAAGLTGQVLTDTAAIAASVKTLLAAKLAAHAGSPDLLVSDVDRTEVVVQTGAAPALAAAIPSGTTAAVAASYSGANLTAKFDAASTTPTPSPITTATVGVYRFFDSVHGTHFFTASTSERDTIAATRPDLISEGVGLQAVDPASKDPNAAAVYRFFDTKFGTHFFTASASERDQVIAGRQDLAFEGTGFYEHTTQQSGDTAVYRFFDKNFGTHFYTADAGERANIVATRSDLVDEGIGFYAPKS